MDQILIFFPMIGLVTWTFLVLLMIPTFRIRAVFKKLIGVGEFRYGESVNIPPKYTLPNRNYMNLLEVPILFYLACLVLYVTTQVDMTFLTLAWAYVATRFVHSLIHITYNDVNQRFSIFLSCNIILLIVWIRLFIGLLDQIGQ